MVETNPSVQITQITPELARSWLKGNTHNRPLRQRVVDDLHDRFMRGEWQLSTDAIAIATDGTIINGQHRLTMIAQLSNDDLGVVVTVMTGAKLELQRIIDSQARRNFGQSLAIDGEKLASITAAATNWLFWYDTGLLFKYRWRKSVGPSQDQLYEVLKWHPGIRKAASWTMSLPTSERMLMGPASIIAAIYDMAHRADVDKAEAFMAHIAGTGIGHGEQIVTLRRKLYAAKLGVSGAATLQTWAVFIYYIKTWNAYCDEKPLTVLRIGKTEATPKMRGYEPPLKDDPNA
jgi:hypothetical protein